MTRIRTIINPNQMPASIVQGIFEVLLEAVFDIACYYVGQIAVPIVSLGRLKCDRFTSGTTRRRIRLNRLFHRGGQQVYLTAEATAVVGFIVIAIAIVIGFLAYHYASRP
jgi:hypothetical protein